MQYLILFSLIVASTFASGQTNYNTQSTVRFNTAPYGMITALPSPPPGTAGNTYLFGAWYSADIFLNDSTKILDAKVKLDLKFNNIEIMQGDAVKLLPASRILYVSMTKNSGEKVNLINEKILEVEGYSANVMLEILYDDNVMLLRKNQLEVIPANGNPNPMSNMSKPENQIVKNEQYLIVTKRQAVLAIGSKFEFREQMIKTFGPSVEPLVKKVNPKKISDLITLVKEMNRLPK